MSVCCLLWTLLQILLVIYFSLVAYGLTIKYILKRKSSRLMIVFGSGGHTTEMLLMLKNINFKKYDRVTLIIGHSDTWSSNKIKDYYLKHRNFNIENDFDNIKNLRLFRSRQVK